MRHLTIERKRSIAAALIKMKVYIEEPSISGRVFPDVKFVNSRAYYSYTPKYLCINGINCRFLGHLKNGEKKTFSIGEKPMRLFVIVSAFDKETFRSTYDISEGKDDVFLSGQNIRSLFDGNPFVFDGEEVPRVSTKLKRKYIRTMIISAIVAGLVSFIYCKYFM